MQRSVLLLLNGCFDIDFVIGVFTLVLTFSGCCIHFEPVQVQKLTERLATQEQELQAKHDEEVGSITFTLQQGNAQVLLAPSQEYSCSSCLRLCLCRLLP